MIPIQNAGRVLDWEFERRDCCTGRIKFRTCAATLPAVWPEDVRRRGNNGVQVLRCGERFALGQDLFEQELLPSPKKTRAELTKDIYVDYYGYRNDDNVILLPLKEKFERQAIQRVVEE